MMYSRLYRCTLVWILLALVGCTSAVPSPVDRGPAGTQVAPPTGPAAVPTALPSATPTQILTPPQSLAPATLTATAPRKDQNAMTPIPSPVPFDPVMQPAVNLAKEDLSKRLSVSTDQIELVSAEAVSWPDGSLGCPQPGMMYTQMVEDGLLIRLRARGTVYEYHSGGNRAPFLCEKPK